MIRDWLRILRLPNLLTVPGDPIAGLCLAAGASAVLDARVAFVALSVVSLYAAGLLLNDALDAETDARERPDRPIPSGRLAWNTVFWTGGVLLWTGVMLAFFVALNIGLIAASLAALICIYNTFLKKHGFWGPVALGVCRGGSMMMGAALAGCSTAALVGAIFLGVYVWAVSTVARTEMQDHADRRLGWMVFFSAVLLLVLNLQIVLHNNNPAILWVALGGSLFCGLAGMGSWTLQGCPPGIIRHRQAPVVIGLWLSLLPLMQASFVLGSGDRAWTWAVALALLLAWLFNRWLARRFYTS